MQALDSHSPQGRGKQGGFQEQREGRPQDFSGFFG